MRSMSAKTRKRFDECREFRKALLFEIGVCELCGSRSFPHLHEIARGQARLRALDKRFALLLLCHSCHMERIHNGPEKWPEARQLALLKRNRPKDLDLEAYNKLVGYGPKRITMEDLEKSE